MTISYLLLGGNLGERLLNLSNARLAIEERCGKITASSCEYETEAWGMKDQPPFLNQALKIETHLPAETLLTELLTIEKSLGRERATKFGPRIIDIDILLYGDAIIEQPHLHIPHPFIQQRRFALVCLNEIASDVKHPVFDKTIQQLLIECTDFSTVHPI